MGENIQMGMLVTKSKLGLSLWGAELLMDGKRYTIIDHNNPLHEE